MTREKRETVTVDMCYFRGVSKSQPCCESPTWKLKGEKRRFKICDTHLAWGIRLSGIPALVEKFEPDPKRLVVIEENPFSKEKEEDSTQKIKFGVKDTLK